MTVRAGWITLVAVAALAPLAGQAPAQQNAPAEQPDPAQQPAPGQQPASQDRVAALKQSLQASLAALRHYEWIETTVISLKGEAKAEKQNRCYYGAEGALQKVPVEGGAEGGGKKPRGLRGRIAENKKEDLTESMQEAVALVKQYVPPDPAKVQAAKDAGRITVSPPDAQGRARVVIRDYLKGGDTLTAELDGAANRLFGISVSSYTDKEKHAVALQLSFAAFADGTLYPAKIALDVKEENLTVDIENSGYRKSSS
jgi:hypothetical protein